MRIAIVNDMPMAIEGMRRVIDGTGIHTIAWVAFGGQEALQNCRTDLPDLILMDIVMPGMNGAETTREIMLHSPCPILLVTSSIDQNSALVFEAMGYGALDAINTPILTGDCAMGGQESLLKKIALLNILAQSVSFDQGNKTTEKFQKLPSCNDSLVVIGASSGGPQALATILQGIPASFLSPIVIVQHVDVQFAQGLAEWLSTLSNIPVRVAQEGGRPSTGTIFLAGSDDHLVLNESGRFHYSSDPQNTPYRPSVDVFWDSLTQHWKGRVTAILLTGMGRDGAKSMFSLHQNGAHTIVQDEQSCAVYGMPKAALALNAVDKVLPVDAIAAALVKNI